MIGLTSTSAFAAATQLGQSRREVSLSVARLSSGNRMTRAADDVAALSVSTRMLARETALRSTLTNLAQADSLLQVADGGLRQVEDMLERMNALTVMAGNGAMSTAERGFLDVEFQNLKAEIDRIATQTTFNGVSLLDGKGVASPENAAIAIDSLLTGSEGSDNLVGDEGNNALYGLEGDDAIDAGAGDDVIDAGTGRDFVNAGQGDDEITVAASVQAVDSALPVTAGLVLHIDAGSESSITAHPGTVTHINDQSSANNDATNDVGAVNSGADTIGGRNSLTFDGASWLQVGDTNDINLLAQNQRSVMISFETGADVTTRQVLYEQGGTVNGFNIYIDNGRLYVGAYKNTGADFDIHLSTDIDANTAYAAGFVFDFSGSGEFRGYLNGSQFASAGVGQGQVGHSGDIGIGGMNNDSRFFDGSLAGDGTAFTGEIGEVLNYTSGLSASEASEVQDYLIGRWGIGTAGTGDTLLGGAGEDTLNISEGKFAATLDENATLREIETIVLSGNEEAHNVNVRDGYYTLGEGLENDRLTIDASGNEEAITVNASELTGDHRLKVLGTTGGDTITGAGTGNLQLSYENARRAMEVDLAEGEARGDGTDELEDVVNLIGSVYNDTLDGSVQDNTIEGGDGNDVITDVSQEKGRLVARDLVHYVSAADTATITTHPGNVTNIADQSGLGNDVLNDTGAVLSGASEIKDKNALEFDGASFLRIATTTDINNSAQAQRSIFMTFQSSDDIESRQVLFEEGGGTSGYNIYIEARKLYVGAWQNGGTTFNLFLSTEIEENTAYTAGFVFDSSGTQTFTGYLNQEAFGQTTVNVAQGAHSGDIGIGGMNNASLFPGAGGVAGDGYIFRGQIGELLIYNAALDDTELKDLQNYLIAERVLNFGGNDILSGGAGDDTITGGGGYDTIDGGTGIDTAVFGGKVSDYRILKLDDDTYRVSDLRAENFDGSDLLIGVEQLRFADGSITLKRFDIDARNLTYQVTEEAAEYLEIVLPNATMEHLFTDPQVNVATREAATEAYGQVRTALAVVTAERAHVGARQAQVGIMAGANDTALREQSVARAVLSDTDITQASTDFALQMLKTNMSAAVLAQANNLQQDIIDDVFYPSVGTVAENTVV